MKIKAYPHRSLNTSKGVLRSPELATCTFEGIKQNLKRQLVTDVKRISTKKNNQIINTNIYILTSNSPKPPPILKIGCIITKVATYILNPLRSYNCQKFSHHESRCTRAKICKNWKGWIRPPGSHLPVLKCVNCQEYLADSRFCDVWKKERDNKN